MIEFINSLNELSWPGAFALGCIALGVAYAVGKLVE